MHMLGMHGAAYANFAIQESDLIVAIGSRFDDRTTGILNKYAPEARRAAEEGRGGLVHFDIEPSQFGRVIDPTVAVAGDCKDALKILLPLVKEVSAGGARRLAPAVRPAEGVVPLLVHAGARRQAQDAERDRRRCTTGSSPCRRNSS